MRIFNSLVILVLSFSLVLPVCVSAQSSDFYNKNFKWSYGGYDYSWNLSIPKALYDNYESVSLYSRIKGGIGGYGFLTTTEDPYIGNMATQLNKSASEKGYGSFETVSFVLCFVQSLRYTSDDVTTGYDEYPRFPVETLVDDGGDCEDTSILFATLVILLGYGTVYLNPEGHVAVGVLGEEGILGYYFQYDERRYYYCETTGDGWGIGDIPEEYEDVKARIYEINLWQQYEASTYYPTATTTPTPRPTSTNTPTPSPKPKQIDWVLIITIATLLVVIAVIAVAYGVERKKKNRPETGSPQYDIPPPPPEWRNK